MQYHNLKILCTSKVARIHIYRDMYKTIFNLTTSPKFSEKHFDWQYSVSKSKKGDVTSVDMKISSTSFTLSSSSSAFLKRLMTYSLVCSRTRLTNDVMSLRRSTVFCNILEEDVHVLYFNSSYIIIGLISYLVHAYLLYVS